MIAIEHIWLLELGKANADCDDIDDESEYGHFTVPELLLCSGANNRIEPGLEVRA